MRNRTPIAQYILDGSVEILCKRYVLGDVLNTVRESHTNNAFSDGSRPSSGDFVSK